MARFKHTGERLKQLQADGAGRIRDRLIEQAENDLGRDLSPAELKSISETANGFKDLPVYGGE